jgi:AraC family transcriptional regulator
LKSALPQESLNDDFSGIFIGIGHDNPHEDGIREDQVRFTAGVALLENNIALDKMEIANGKYARFRYQGKPVNLGMAYHYIYGKWQESSNHKIIQTIPAFVSYEHFPEGFREECAFIHVPLVDF